ncbi:GNAT family N-acetyltransferase [Lihuaxuella thermophila]|uniref:Predicted N-acetyltransferase YhbS n=1 Tax=Lihuaxuella thermophila TaxID=1173111 RepID=A0A1H8BQB2_9BACL|nr:GNAT family N-acetyltransferase [Lihuaxuella thermophila]SEM84719.1 Predicted N-acetyltransferase YhbS [Lihuaxuella thermophila]
MPRMKGMRVMLEIRPVEVGELPQAKALADQTFRDWEQKSMADGFPHIFSDTLAGQSFAAFEDGKMVTFLGLVPSVICVGRARLSVYSLGSVCTHPDYRGRGYASKVLEKVLAHVEGAGASLLLVSGTGPLYTRANCHLFGDVFRFVIKPDSAESLFSQHVRDDVQVREWKPVDWLKIAGAAARRTTRYEQSVWDLAMLVRAEAYASCVKLRHKVLVAEREGELEGFVVVGVPHRDGKKHPPTAFEWAGSPEVVGMLLAAAVERYHLQQLEVPVPWHEQALIRSLESYEVKRERNLGTVNIIHPERLIAQLRPYLREKDGELECQFSVRFLETGRTQIRLGKESGVLDSAELVSLVFDPEPKIRLDSHFKHLLAQLFPIPFPYTGGLNYV